MYFLFSTLIRTAIRSLLPTDSVSLIPALPALFSHNMSIFFLEVNPLILLLIPSLPITPPSFHLCNFYHQTCLKNIFILYWIWFLTQHQWWPLSSGPRSTFSSSCPSLKYLTLLTFPSSSDFPLPHLSWSYTVLFSPPLLPVSDPQSPSQAYLLPILCKCRVSKALPFSHPSPTIFTAAFMGQLSPI